MSGPELGLGIWSAFLQSIHAEFLLGKKGTCIEGQTEFCYIMLSSLRAWLLRHKTFEAVNDFEYSTPDPCSVLRLPGKKMSTDFPYHILDNSSSITTRVVIEIAF